jgi:hypothetical protein
MKDWSAWVSKLLQTFWPVGLNFEFPDMVFCSEHTAVGRFGNPVEPGKIFRCPPWRTVNLRLILPFIHARLFVNKIHVSFIYVCVSARPVFNSYIKTFLSEVLGFLWFIFLEAYLKADPTNLWFGKWVTFCCLLSSGSEMTARTLEQWYIHS